MEVVLETLRLNRDRGQTRERHDRERQRAPWHLLRDDEEHDRG
jgi:hypothetical protein